MTDTRRKIVPVEATNDMTDAGAANLFETSFHDGPTVQVESTYTAMVAAAPDASEDDELVESVARGMAAFSLEDDYTLIDALDFLPIPEATLAHLARVILKTIEGTHND